MPRAPKPAIRKTQAAFEQSEEFHTSNQPKTSIFAPDSIYFFILSERSC